MTSIEISNGNILILMACPVLQQSSFKKEKHPKCSRSAKESTCFLFADFSHCHFLDNNVCAYRLFRSVKRPFQSSGRKKKSVISILTLFFLFAVSFLCDSFKECRLNCFVLFLHSLVVSYFLNHTGSMTVFHTPTSLFVVIDLV